MCARRVSWAQVFQVPFRTGREGPIFLFRCSRSLGAALLDSPSLPRTSLSCVAVAVDVDVACFSLFLSIVALLGLAEKSKILFCALFLLLL